MQILTAKKLPLKEINTIWKSGETALKFLLKGLTSSYEKQTLFFLMSYAKEHEDDQYYDSFLILILIFSAILTHTGSLQTEKILDFVSESETICHFSDFFEVKARFDLSEFCDLFLETFTDSHALSYTIDTLLILIRRAVIIWKTSCFEILGNLLKKNQKFSDQQHLELAEMVSYFSQNENPRLAAAAEEILIYVCANLQAVKLPLNVTKDEEINNLEKFRKLQIKKIKLFSLLFFFFSI